MGGASMGLFFLISGFVMTLGYGQTIYTDSGGMCCEAFCCIFFDGFYCCVPSYSANRYDTLQEANTQNKISFKIYDFFLKRFARLAPLYYLTNLLAIPYHILFFTNVIYLIVIGILSFFVVTSWVLGLQPLNGALWSISTMGFFYLCFPCIIVRIQQFKTFEELVNLARKMYIIQCCTFFLFLFFIICGAQFDLYFTWRTFPPNRLPVFIMGCCAGLMRIRVSQQENHHSTDDINLNSVVRTLLLNSNDSTSPMVIFILTIIFGIILSIINPGLGGLLRILTEIFYPILYFDWILILTHSKKDETSYVFVEQFLRSNVMQFMGEISMSFYMIHIIVMIYTALLIHYIQTKQWYWEDAGIALIPSWSIPFVLCISIFLGWILTVFYEIPIQNKILSHFKRKSNTISILQSLTNRDYVPVSCIDIQPTTNPLNTNDNEI